MELPVKYRQSAPESVRYIAGQAAVQISGDHAGPVGGLHRTQSPGGLPGQKVLYRLGGSQITAAAQLEGGLLPVPLEGHARQRMVGAKVSGVDPHQEAAVDVPAVSGPVAHTVGHQPPLLRGGGHHLAAGTDTEGKGRAAVGQVTGQLVVGGGELLPGRAELSQRNSALGMLDAHPDGEGLLLHGHTGLVEHLEGVPGGVAG